MSTEFTPTLEQLAIITAATDTKDNLLISALAGAAKTSTLVLIANALSDVNTICLAFNKKTALEMADRLPENCVSKTLNSLGNTAWADALGRRTFIDFKKIYKCFQTALNDYTPKEQENLWKSYGAVRNAVNVAKAGGHVPNAIHKKRPKNFRLWDDSQLWSSLEEEPSTDEWDIILSVLTLSMEQAFEGRLDFNDQLLMPSVFPAPYPIHTLILVDEVQDLSALNHLMLSHLYRRRIIAVGDSCQAIYGFRGAYANGMDQIKDKFSMTKLELTCSFRCPEEIVDHVRWRAPAMKSWPDTPAGSVSFVSSWSIRDIPDHAAVICRNNAPLLRLAIELIRARRYPNLWGNDIAAGIVKQLKSFGAGNMSREQLLIEIDQWETDKLKRARNLRTISDRADCFRIFAREGANLAEAIISAQSVFNSEGMIDLMTGHKSKGHEFRQVFFLDESLISVDGQDPNLRYVIATRAMRELTYITTEGCFEMAKEK